MTKKNETSTTDKAMQYDALLCTDLLSDDFSNFINESFENETARRKVPIITRAYYVFIDLKAGYHIDKIEKYRLEKFHSVLWGYVLKNKKDLLSKQLWDVCDNVLSEISA